MGNLITYYSKITKYYPVNILQISEHVGKLECQTKILSLIYVCKRTIYIITTGADVSLRLCYFMSSCTPQQGKHEILSLINSFNPEMQYLRRTEALLIQLLCNMIFNTVK